MSRNRRMMLGFFAVFLMCSLVTFAEKTEDQVLASQMEALILELEEETLPFEFEALLEQWIVQLQTFNPALSSEDIYHIRRSLELTLKQCIYLTESEFNLISGLIMSELALEPFENLNRGYFQNLLENTLRLKVMAKDDDGEFVELLVQEIEAGLIFSKN